MAITQPVGSQEFITKAQEYFLKPATIIYDHSGCFHPHTLASHQQTWNKLGRTVVTCSVILITVCSFRCAEGPRGDFQGQAVPKGTRQYCVCCRQRIKSVLAQNAAQHRAGLPSTQRCLWDINMRNILLHIIPVSFGYLPAMQKERKGNFKNHLRVCTNFSADVHIYTGIWAFKCFLNPNSAPSSTTWPLHAVCWSPGVASCMNCLPGMGHWIVLKTAPTWKYYMYQHGNIINMQILGIFRCWVSVPLTEVCMNMQKLGNSCFQNSCFWIANAYFALDLACMRRALLLMLWDLPRMAQRPSACVCCQPLCKVPAGETVPKGPAV